MSKRINDPAVDAYVDDYINKWFEEATIRKAREILEKRAKEGHKVEPLQETSASNVSGSK